MTQAEIDFLDNYKRLESFLRDAYDCDSGVSTYLAAMETSRAQGQLCIDGWQNFERRLKYLRHIRNIITHDARSGGCCGEEDVATLETIIDLFMQRKDPMSLLRIARSSAPPERRQPISVQKFETTQRPHLRATPPPEAPKPKKSRGGVWVLAAVFSVLLVLLLTILFWIAYGTI